MGQTYEAATKITGVDTQMAGRARVTSAYLLHGEQPALVETGPTTTADAVKAGLAAIGLGPGDLSHIVVTHIHLDHAGGVGRLAAHFPRAVIWVHERGARHLADPTKLVQSVATVYGEDRMRRLFGPVDPVPGDRLRPIGDGDVIKLGGRSIEVVYTPGHASHHVALVDSESGAVFTGDALGIHFPDSPVLRPATPPPDIDVELGLESIEAIRNRADSVLLFSHFGPVSDVDEICSIAASRLRTWAGIVRDAMQETEDLDRIAQLLERRTAEEFDQAEREGLPVDRERYGVLLDARINAAGLVRYWSKKGEREADSAT
jgi:glyoxylase-like metal-dependent hydrolase (beta-lactamase superfamily II)